MPTKNQSLRITRRERDFRKANRLCSRCGNHFEDDGMKWTLHPIYEDITVDDDNIMGKEIAIISSQTSIAALPKLAAEALTVNQEHIRAHLRTSELLAQAFPLGRRSRITNASRKAQQKVPAAAQVLASSGEWLDVKLFIDTYSQRTYITQGLIETHNLDTYVCDTPYPLSTRAHLRDSLMISHMILQVLTKQKKRKNMVSGGIEPPILALTARSCISTMP